MKHLKIADWSVSVGKKACCSSSVKVTTVPDVKMGVILQHIINVRAFQSK
jgi:hypothetical protein